MLLAVAVFRCAHLWTAPNIYIYETSMRSNSSLIHVSIATMDVKFVLISLFLSVFVFFYFLVAVSCCCAHFRIRRQFANVPSFMWCDTHKHIRTKTVCLLFSSVLIFWSSHRLHCILRLANWPSRRRIFGSLQMLLHATPCNHCAQAMVCSTVITLLLTVGRQSFIFLSFVGRNCFICCVVLCSVCRSAVEYQRRMPSCSW